MTNRPHDEDQQMEDYQNSRSGGQREERLHRSSLVERHSRSPTHRRSQRQADPEPSPWTHDPFTDAILHDTDLCSVCKGYFDHYHQSRRQKSPSLEDALEEQAALTIPIKEHEKLYAKYEEHTEQGWEMFEEIKSLHTD